MKKLILQYSGKMYFQPMKLSTGYPFFKYEFLSLQTENYFRWIIDLHMKSNIMKFPDSTR